jgi:hypothetical protein
MKANLSANVHIYDMSEESISILHWIPGTEDRYTVKISDVIFFISGDDFRNEFVPRMLNAMSDTSSNTREEPYLD